MKKTIALQPEQMFAHYELGVALYETGDLKTAAGHFEIVASRMPKWADARYSLGSVYARIDRIADATKELRAALDLEPRHFRANLLLGRILTLQGTPAARDRPVEDGHRHPTGIGRGAPVPRRRVREGGTQPPKPPTRASAPRRWRRNIEASLTSRVTTA